jgi:hypothetical protein
MKNIKPKMALLIMGFLFLVKSSLLFAQGPPPPVTVAPPPPIPAEDLWRQGLKPLPVEKVSPGVFRLGEITIYKETGTVVFPAKVNMDKGLLEYLLVRSSGKTHESLLRTEVDPYNLQIAFLLVGFEGTDQPLAFQGAPETPRGNPVEIVVEYKNQDGKIQSTPPEKWVVKRSENASRDVGKIDWVFTGSEIIDNRFMAQMDGSIVAIYHDPIAMIDNASPGGESDEIWFVKEGVVPPAGTPVTITIKAKKQSAAH